MSMRPPLLPALGASLLLLGSGHCPPFAVASDSSAEKDLLATLQETGLEEKWRVEQGAWEIRDGVLRASAPSMADALASVRCPLHGSDAECEIRFRFLGGAKAFHITFKPEEGDLEKEGLLFSVVAARTSTKIIRHRDRSLPGDQNRAVAAIFHPLNDEEWHTLKIRSAGEEVTVTIDEEAPIRASDPSFAIEKSCFFLRLGGGQMEIDRFVITVAETASPE